MRHVEARVQRAQAATTDPDSRHEDRLLGHALLRDLLHRREHLMRLHARIGAAQGRDCERLWQRFFLCYDDFIQALQQAPPPPSYARGVRATASLAPGRVRR